MNETAATPAPAPVPTPSIGFAVASLSLGIIAIFTSFLLVGIVAGLLGLIFGWVQLARSRAGRGMALWGLILSVIGMLLGGTFAGLYYKAYQKVREMQQGMGATEPAFEAWYGKPAPDLSVTTLDGQALKLSDLKGRRVVVDFWATWCPPCRKEIPHFVDLAKEIPAEQLLIVGISNEDEELLRTFAKNNNVNYPMASVSDEDLPEPYNQIRSIPTTFFIDRNGIIQNVEVGYTALEELRALATAEDMVVEDAGAVEAP